MSRSRTVENSPSFRTPIGIDGKTPVPARRKGRRSLMPRPGLLDKPSTESSTKPAVLELFPPIISPEVSAFFRGRDLPTDVWAYTGTAYYKSIEDIPTQSLPNRNVFPKVDSYEDRAAVALQVCPPKEGEAADASFKFVGERGLYVRVILTKTGEIMDSNKPAEKKERWMPYNEENVEPRNLRYS